MTHILFCIHLPQTKCLSLKEMFHILLEVGSWNQLTLKLHFGLAYLGPPLVEIDLRYLGHDGLMEELKFEIIILLSIL